MQLEDETGAVISQALDPGTELATIPDEKVEKERLVMVKLLKTPVRGGILTLTNQELVLGEGFLGTQNVRKVSLKLFARLDILPSPGDRAMQRSKLLRFVWIDGQTTDVDGVGPVAAQRIQYVLQALRRPVMRQYMF